MMTDSSVPEMKGRILVIDDDEDFLEMTESFLDENYEVTLAVSGGWRWNPLPRAYRRTSSSLTCPCPAWTATKRCGR
jgi:CheY-like chemotaxis protein